MNLSGIIPYLVTPYDTEKSVLKLDSLENLSESLIEKGVHGLSPLGSTGEVHYLTSSEKIEVVKTVVKTASKRVPVVPGITAYSTHDAINQINKLEKIGIDGIVVILSTYFPLKRNQIIGMLKTVSRNVSCPIVLYNNPKFSNVDLSPEIVIELSSEPNIQYFKDATGNTGRILSIMKNTGNKIKIFSASAHIPVHVMQLGGVGWMAGPSCVFPEKSIELFDLTEQGDWDAALKLQVDLWSINESFQKYDLVPCIKSLLNRQGYNVGEPILPLKGLSHDQEINLIEMLKHLL